MISSTILSSLVLKELGEGFTQTARKRDLKTIIKILLNRALGHFGAHIG